MMRAKLLILLTITAFFYGCSKDEFNTKPSLSFAEANTTELRQGNLLIFSLDFTDKEGDIQDTLWVQKISTTCPTTPGVQFISPYRVPNFTGTANLKGKLEITFVYNANVPGTPSIVGCTNRNDTSYFRFWLKDKANNRSDTVRSPDIILIR